MCVCVYVRVCARACVCASGEPASSPEPTTPVDRHPTTAPAPSVRRTTAGTLRCAHARSLRRNDESAKVCAALLLRRGRPGPARARRRGDWW